MQSLNLKASKSAKSIINVMKIYKHLLFYTGPTITLFVSVPKMYCFVLRRAFGAVCLIITSTKNAAKGEPRKFFKMIQVESVKGALLL